jgi:tetratricopeptide (TPR) repeat protein
MSMQRELQLDHQNKKVKSNSLIISKQKEIIENFTGKSFLNHMNSLFKIYLGTGEVIEAFRILKTIGQHFPDNLYVVFQVFQFYLNIGNLRKAESFLLRIIASLKESKKMLTLYSILLFQMKKYKEALINYRVTTINFFFYFFKYFCIYLKKNL